MSKSIRGVLRDFVLNKKLKKKSIERQIVNLNKAKSIGVLLDANDSSKIREVQDFCKKWTSESKQVTLLGFSSRKNKETVPINFFTEKDLNWLRLPKSSVGKHFLAQKFDVVIDTSSEKDTMLTPIAALSRAKLRVGRYYEGKTNFYDVMFNISEGGKTPQFLNEVDYYLKTINHAS